MTDAAIIDAYEHAYGVAQEVGADGRTPELPPMKDRQTMARRVRGYVTTSKGEGYGSSTTAGRATSAERKALATMGRRGGKKAAERWKDRDNDYVQAELEKLQKANQKREWQGDALMSEVKSAILRSRIETGTDPSTKDLAAEFNVSVSRIKQIRQALGMQAARGRPKKITP